MFASSKTRTFVAQSATALAVGVLFALGTSTGAGASGVPDDNGRDAAARNPACTVTVTGNTPGVPGDAYSYNVPTVADGLASVQPFVAGAPGTWWIDCADGITATNSNR